MSREDWYRNADWNPGIEEAFFLRLRRSRDKSQRLRIQASYLSKTHPRTALRLLDEYFLLGERFDLAQAHADRANALVTLHDIEGALSSYQNALERERQFPNYKTNAYLNFILLVVNARKAQLYAKALEVLDAHRDCPLFPVDCYTAHGARALILHELGRAVEARSNAKLARAAAAETQSGFRYHQDLGLVGVTDDEFSGRIAGLAS